MRNSDVWDRGCANVSDAVSRKLLTKRKNYVEEDKKKHESLKAQANPHRQPQHTQRLHTFTISNTTRSQTQSVASFGCAVFFVIVFQSVRLLFFFFSAAIFSLAASFEWNMFAIEWIFISVDLSKLCACKQTKSVAVMKWEKCNAFVSHDIIIT